MVEFYQIKLENLEYLPSMPSVLNKLLEVLNDNSVSNKEIAKIIALDSSISAKILSIANSALFGATNPITDINMAVIRLGRIDVKTITMTLFVSNMLKRFKLKNVNIEHFWKHNLAVAFISRRLLHNYKGVGELSEENRTNMYLSGLFHDIGYILFDQVNPEVFKRIKTQAIENNESFIELEKIIMHTTHAHEGAELLKYWKLPRILYDTIRFHHEPMACPFPDLKMYSEVLHVADYFANAFEVSTLNELDNEPISDLAWNNFDFADFDTDEYNIFKNELYSQTRLFISFSELALSL